MKKLLFVLLTLLSLSSCKDQKIPKNEGYKYIYSNLTDEKSKKDVKDLMEKSSLGKNNIERFFKQVDFFNSNIDKTLLASKDYQKSNQIPEYDVDKMQDSLFNKYPEFAGVNCRITTFGLVSDKIQIKNKEKSNLSAIEIDNSSFKNPPVPTLEGSEIEKFNKFYSAIKTDNTGDSKIHLEKINNFWKENGVSFPKSDKFSIISVFVFSSLDENDNELFIGHTGILFTLDDNRFLLVEKLAFTSPYQSIVFENKKDLYDYLMKMYDFSSEAYPAKPLIFENDNLLEDWKTPANAGVFIFLLSQKFLCLIYQGICGFLSFS